MDLADQYQRTGTLLTFILTRKALYMEFWSKYARDALAYTLPDISDEELKYRPYAASEYFSKDLEAMVSAWRKRYGTHLTRHSVSTILQEMILRLEKNEHKQRKEQKERRDG